MQKGVVRKILSLMKKVPWQKLPGDGQAEKKRRGSACKKLLFCYI